MRNKSKIKTNILILGISFAIAAVSNLSFTVYLSNNDGTTEIRDITNLKSPKSSANWITNFIHIDGNWSATASTYAWCSGDGSWGNPYTIENVTINATSSPTESGIYIENSNNEYFIIRDCTVYNAGTEYYHAGIKLENTNNGALINNNCSNNGENGILLINYCENNTISENNVDNNGGYGILLLRSSNNLISDNIITYNDIGIYLWVDCMSNTLSGNTVNENTYGIRLYPNCNNNLISKNTVNANYNDGIDLNGYCDNNIISENTISNEGAFDQDIGIRLSSNCKNNIIARNIIRNNGYLGIYIYDSTCQDNIIYHNLFIGTDDWHAQDEGTNNHWNASGIGNYWDNHTSPDSDNDGIVDIPYTWIIGSAGSEDSFPLAISPLHAGEKIHIDNDGVNAPNWSRTAELYFWCTGTGTFTDPYIIDGLEIDAGDSGSCILIENSYTYFIIRNCTVYNAGSISGDGGIRLEDTSNGILIDNNCSNNGRYGVILISCDSITISGNIANNNGQHGIMLIAGCDNNNILGNSANNNSQHGIYLSNLCNSNNISGNSASYNINHGIAFFINCDYNTISGNTVNDNIGHGIRLREGCDYNTVSGNIVNNNGYDGIHLRWLCHENTISGNNANNNDNSGIYLREDCDNNIITENLFKDNQLYGIVIADIACQNNLVFHNSLVGTTGSHASDSGTNNNWDNSVIGNYWDNHTSPDSDNDGIVDFPYSWITGSAGSEDRFPLAASPLHIGDKIRIDDDGVNAPNWSRTAELYFWCTGLGNYSDPYILDGLKVDAGGSGSGILIENSNVYFIIRNCEVYNSPYGPPPYSDAAIRLNIVNNGVLVNNSLFNNDYGINIEGSYHKITGNNIIGTGSATGIFLVGNHSLIQQNTIDNCWQGILLYIDCDNNEISANSIKNSVNHGIILNTDCDNNAISENTANNNNYGITVYRSNNNTITGNAANNNAYYGIYVYYDSNNNTFSGNTANNNNYGIYVYRSNNNTISENTANNNSYHGIYLYYNSNNNTISGNMANNNSYHGIYLYYECDGNIVSGNLVKQNDQYGISLSDNCDENTIMENVIYYNVQYGVLIDSLCVDNLIYLNDFKNEYNAIDDGNNQWDNGTIGNYWDDYEGVDANDDGIGDTPYIISGSAGSQDNFPIWEDGIDIIFLFVEIFDQIFSTEGFNITFYVYNGINEGIDFATIQMWWNGVEVSTSIQNLGSGLYFVSLEPITVEPGEDPILLNMSVFATGYPDKYFEIYIAVEPSEIAKLLQVEIIENFYSLEYFNLTFFVCDEAEQGIDSATIQIWWNGVDVSGSVINLGNGLYFVSLAPITVAPGEDPILLNMIISANGYQDKSFETYLAVDPDILDKETGKPAEEFPLTIIIIAVISIVGGIGIAGISIVLLRKKKRSS